MPLRAPRRAHLTAICLLSAAVCLVGVMLRPWAPVSPLVVILMPDVVLLAGAVLGVAACGLARRRALRAGSGLLVVFVAALLFVSWLDRSLHPWWVEVRGWEGTDLTVQETMRTAFSAGKETTWRCTLAVVCFRDTHVEWSGSIPSQL